MLGGSSSSSGRGRLAVASRGRRGHGGRGAQGWCRGASGDVQADGEGCQAVLVQGLRRLLGQGTHVGVEVVDATDAVFLDRLQTRPAQHRLGTARQRELLLAGSHVDLERVDAGFGLERLGVVARRHGEGGVSREHGHDKDRVGEFLVAVGLADEVVAATVVGAAAAIGIVGGVTLGGTQVRPVPVDDLVLGDKVIRRGGAGLVGGNVRLGDVAEAIVGHVVDPLGRAVVVVSGGQRADVVRLAVVVPGDDLDKGGLRVENVVPAVLPEQVGREDKVLAVADLDAVVGAEPGRHGGDVRLGGPQPLAVVHIALHDRDVAVGRRRLVVAVAVPAHPVEGAVDDVGVGRLVGAEVGGEEDVHGGGTLDGRDVEAVASKRRGKDLAVDLELGGIGAVVGNLLADLGGVIGGEPVEVEREEDLHVVVGGGLVGVGELLVGEVVGADVEGEGVDAQVFGQLHIRVVIGGTCPVRDDANHEVAKDQLVRGGGRGGTVSL